MIHLRGGHAPRETVRGHTGPLVRLPGRVPVLPRLGAVLAGGIEDTLGGAETVASGVERFLGALASGVSFG